MTIMDCAEAHAAQLYIETNGGVASLMGSRTYFDNRTQDTLKLGIALNVTAAVDLSPKKDRVRVHLGVQQRVGMGSDGTGHYGVMATYPMIRVESMKLYLGFGISPLVWSHTSPAFSLTGWDTHHPRMSYLAEIGSQWPITPEISFIAQGAGQMVRLQGGTFSPKPSLEATVGFRFFVGGGSSAFAKAERESVPLEEYSGWRYPFGSEMNDN